MARKQAKRAVRKVEPEMAVANGFGPASAQGIGSQTPMGANLAPGGATFRVWAPNAIEVHILLARSDHSLLEKQHEFQPTIESRLFPILNGHWAGFVPGVHDGDHYRFYLVGRAQPYVRDPYARELEFHHWPDVDGIVRSAASYPWHDREFRTPEFRDFVIYQFHFGTWFGTNAQGNDVRNQRVAKFLDAVAKIPYLASLGVNAVQPLPVTEYNSVPDPHDPTPRSLGYNGTDLFSPEMDYGVEPQDLPRYLEIVNRLLADKGQPPLTQADLEPQVNQLKAFIDLCHLYGIAVLLDVVYNHAGGFDRDQQNLFAFDDERGGRLYFQEHGWAGGLVFNFARPDVRQFLINNARFFLNEYHVDGFRYDEVSVIDDHGGWSFCQDLTGTVKYQRPTSLHIAEFWKNEQSWAVRPQSVNGAGFDAVVHGGLRYAVRSVLSQAARGRDTDVNLDTVRDALRLPEGFRAPWQMVQHLENHDRQRVQNTNDREPRIAALGDATNARSWYARSRARVANALLLTAPGIPMIFMGQEILEDKYWTDDPNNHPGHLVWWNGLEQDRAMQDHLQFMRELLQLRHKHPALRSDLVNPYYTHNLNRVMAVQRWIEGVGRDVVIVASLNETAWQRYELGFPQPGRWLEVFNSDFYDHWPNPLVFGNSGAIDVDSLPRDGMPASAMVRIPANGVVVFARDAGD